MGPIYESTSVVLMFVGETPALGDLRGTRTKIVWDGAKPHQHTQAKKTCDHFTQEVSQTLVCPYLSILVRMGINRLQPRPDSRLLFVPDEEMSLTCIRCTREDSEYLNLKNMMKQSLLSLIPN